MNRLGFIRYCLLALVAAVGAVLWRRACGGRGDCRGCAEFGRCRLPWKEGRR